MVALCLFVGMSGAAWAIEHVVHVEDGFGPVAGVNIDIFIKTGPGANDWDHQIVQTDGFGDAILDWEPNANAVYWYAILDAQESPEAPLNDWIQEAEYPDFDILWIIE